MCMYQLDMYALLQGKIELSMDVYAHLYGFFDTNRGLLYSITFPDKSMIILSYGNICKCQYNPSLH